MVCTWRIERILLIMEIFGTICAIIVLLIIGALFFISFLCCAEDGLLTGCVICGCISAVCLGIVFINCLKLSGLKATKNDETSSSAEASHSECDIQESTEKCTVEINGQVYEIIPIQ